MFNHRNRMISHRRSYLKQGDWFKQWIMMKDFPVNKHMEDSPVVGHVFGKPLIFLDHSRIPPFHPIPSAAEVLMASTDDKILTLCLTFLENVLRQGPGPRFPMSRIPPDVQTPTRQAVQFLPELKSNKNAPSGNFSKLFCLALVENTAWFDLQYGWLVPNDSIHQR